MKVDTKIVPNTVKHGWFKKEEVIELRIRIELTDVEKAQIIKAGLQDYEILSAESEYNIPLLLTHWVGEVAPDEYSTCYCTSNFHAKTRAAELKQNLQTLKQALEAVSDVGDEESFEL